jgi:hypothetical protein
VERSGRAGPPTVPVALDSTGSEIIMPVTDPAGRVVGTLDVESAQIDAFGDATRRELERVAAVLPPLYAVVTFSRSSDDFRSKR